jgi:hypothetical protein
MEKPIELNDAETAAVAGGSLYIFLNFGTIESSFNTASFNTASFNTANSYNAVNSYNADRSHNTWQSYNPWQSRLRLRHM